MAVFSLNKCGVLQVYTIHLSPHLNTTSYNLHLRLYQIISRMMELYGVCNSAIHQVVSGMYFKVYDKITKNNFIQISISLVVNFFFRLSWNKAYRTGFWQILKLSSPILYLWIGQKKIENDWKGCYWRSISNENLIVWVRGELGWGLKKSAVIYWCGCGL